MDRKKEGHSRQKKKLMLKMFLIRENSLFVFFNNFSMICEFCTLTIFPPLSDTHFEALLEMFSFLDLGITHLKQGIHVSKGTLYPLLKLHTETKNKSL